MTSNVPAYEVNHFFNAFDRLMEIDPNRYLWLKIMTYKDVVRHMQQQIAQMEDYPDMYLREVKQRNSAAAAPDEDSDKDGIIDLPF